MHLGNLSFLMSGARVLGLTPVYDMLPAQYAGQHGHLRSVAFQPPAPGPAAAEFWEPASRAAVDVWQRVATHSLISADFRRIARHNSTLVEGFRDAARLLPAAH
jgi:hypothetical protein